MIELLPFQRDFLAGALAPGTRLAALSVPRGNGKSTLAAHLLLRCLTPGDPLHEPGAEYVMMAASIGQAVRSVFKPTRRWLDGNPDYRIAASANRASITHKPTGTIAQVISSKGETAMGLVGVPLVVADEPGAWLSTGGTLMFDAIETAQGKPGSPLRAVFIGTIAPASGGWWPQLIEGGTRGGSYVQALQGDRSRWDEWPEIRRVNPLMSRFAESRAVLRDERDQARRDSRLKARFLSYRCNVPSADESEVLLTVDDWERVTAREVPPRAGRPVVGVDLGGGRAWSAAVAIWQSGRVEALAVAPGLPDLEAQERRDRMPPGLYGALADSGALRVASGLRVQPPGALVAAVREAWGWPGSVVCDRFRLPELRDAAPPGLPIVPRVTRWSEASFDIRALRKHAADGPLACPEPSRALVAASLAVAMVRNDDAGSVRLAKRGTENAARDDVAAALTLAAGSFERARARPRGGSRYRGMVG